MPEVITAYPHTDAALADYRQVIGPDFDGYRNHCTRMLNFVHALLPEISDEDSWKVQIAAAFHDIGLWTENRVDYLEPSVAEAHSWLAAHDKTEFAEEIGIIIDMHHLQSTYEGPYETLVEVFRRGDLVDFSLGWIKKGVDRSFVKAVRQAIPNAGFHWRLCRFTMLQLTRNPLRPLPMLRFKNQHKQ